jgi:Cys-tRNA(Pro)/Cys-tRNA(Cys) deacylase
MTDFFYDGGTVSPPGKRPRYQDKRTVMKRAPKTNVERILSAAGIACEILDYSVDEDHLDALSVARSLGLDPETVFKTLVARDEKQQVLVFCVPGSSELDLKKAARAAGVKRIEMLGVRQLLPVTGYVRGGCSPMGMKRRYPTYLDEYALACEKITVSAGVRGRQVRLAPRDLQLLTAARLADLV